MSMYRTLKTRRQTKTCAQAFSHLRLQRLPAPVRTNQLCRLDARQQQFAATNLVMGLVPLIVKDIAWPRRRMARVSDRLPFVVEVIRDLCKELTVTKVLGYLCNQLAFVKRLNEMRWLTYRSEVLT